MRDVQRWDDRIGCQVSGARETDMGVSLSPPHGSTTACRPGPPVQDNHPMSSSFYSSIKPASYPRDSSISWCPGFFGNGSRYLPGSFPNLFPFPLVSLVDLQDTGKVSAFVESDRGSTMNHLSAIEREGDLVSLFTAGLVSRY